MTITKAEVRLVGKDATAEAFRSVIRNAETAQKSIVSKFRGAFALLGVGSVVTGLSRMVTGAIRAGDELAKFSQKSGLGARAASELAHAAKMADLDLGSLATGVKFLQKNLSEAASGSKSAQEPFRALGLEWNRLRKLAPDLQLEQIADQIAQIEDPADRTRVAVELFGRSGADLLPLFSQGAEGIRRAREEAVQLGKSFSEDDLRRFQQADEAFKKLKASGGALGDTLGLILAPELAKMADSLRITLGGGNSLEKLQREMENTALVANSLYFGLTPPPHVIAANEKLIALRRQLNLLAVSRQPNTIGQPTPNAPGFQSDEAKKARAEIEALSGPVAKLTVQFEAQRAKIQELVAKYPELAGAAGQAIAAITKDFRNSVIDAQYELAKLEVIEERMRAARGQPLEQVEIGGDSDVENTRVINETMTEIINSNIELRSRTVELDGEFFEVNESAKTLMETLKDEGARRAVGYISDAIMGLSDGARNFAKGMIDAFRRILADKAAQQLMAWFESLGRSRGGGGGLFGILGQGLGLLFGGSGGGLRLPRGTIPTVPGSYGRGYASGGFMSPGSWGIVGERGPELAFAGNQGATIVPFEKARGGAPVVNISMVTNVDARGATKPGAEELLQRLPAILDEHRRATVTEAEYRVVEGIRRQKYALG